MPKVNVYKGYDIWITPNGYFRAYSSDGKPIGKSRSSFTGIKELIKSTLSRAQEPEEGEKE